ncbi:oligopeptide/dipeptide ABC transporter ATPase subunit [Pandoraea eparura]|jgi:peptide/nickel transport system ATP-binding protein|uniref:Oligopeptide/dipeptide ABC transporter ATPase subunit n=1 Tax=Pandoraea eparura TaxID=2508291 RepID=A0A5E4S594_9BURK|nr:ABC transporter ATP-binding protein [Pandoraea eparura]VVD70381.1 oligopeptide/dipeptide ABC transporter ATPase subunit [Pandoraea eparura]
MSDIVKVSDLRVTARNDMGEDVPIVHGVDFSIQKGEVLALIGESGSGKTTIALALMGYARAGCHLAGGTVTVAGHQVLSMNESQLANLRGRTVSYIAQSAAASFNPAKRLMDQVVESAMIHKVMSREVAEAKAVELFRALALPEPEKIGMRYPHQVSGGQLQRLMAAMAMITDPELVIMDEPTTALDVTTQIEVLRAFKKVVKERGSTAVYVSHDLAVVAQMADRIVVLRDGEIRETGSTTQILSAPAHPYTKSLLAAIAPKQRNAAASFEAKPSHEHPLLEVCGLYASYGIARRGAQVKCVLDDINLVIPRGATIGVIGESGSGKTTLARAIAGMVAPSEGEILLDGKRLAPTLEGRTREQFRRIQFVFQNADTALNPLHSIERILARPLEFYHGMKGEARRKRVLQLLDLVRLPATVAARLPGELSGGQKQRINLARALAAQPDLILCDEVTSALDTVVGAAILELMAELRKELNVSYMFISHDISTVRAICDDIVVMYAGHKVEARKREALALPPFHPYSHLLISSVPALRRGWLEEVGGHNPAALPALAPAGQMRGICSFLDRCPLRVDGVCNSLPPPRQMLDNGGSILCHRSESELRSIQTPLRVVEGAVA